MALTAGKNGKAHVLEISNRATVQKLSSQDAAGIAVALDNHMSGLNTNSHGISNIAGLQTALNDKESVFSKNTAFNKNFGTTSGTVCQGDDSRLSDTRTPTEHTHTISDVSGLQTALNGKVDNFTGFTGSLSVVTHVDFPGESVTTKTITVDNGIIVSIV